MPRRLIQFGLVSWLGVLIAMSACGGQDDGGEGGGGSTSKGGASSSGGSGGGMCVNIAGTWTVRTHCQTQLVGQQIQVTQTGCMFKDMSLGISGTMQANGTFTASGMIPVLGNVTCTGTATAKSITENCTVAGAPCAVTLDR